MSAMTLGWPPKHLPEDRTKCWRVWKVRALDKRLLTDEERLAVTLTSLKRHVRGKVDAMPHYNLYFTDGKRIWHDGDGLNLPDDAAAHKEAEQIAFDLWDDPDGGDWSEWTIRVTDETGRDVASVPIGHRSKVLRVVSGWVYRLTGFGQAVY